jgi:hypothetical protein
VTIGKVLGIVGTVLMGATLVVVGVFIFGGVLAAVFSTSGS